MNRSLVAVALVLGFASVLQPVFAQTQSTEVAPVTVTGRREPPPELLPDPNACKAAQDPYVQALRAVGGHPRIYVSTRWPRNPDYNAPPLTPPHSALPQVWRARDYERYVTRMRRAGVDRYNDISLCYQALDRNRSSSVDLNRLETDGTFSSLQVRPMPARAEIGSRDRTLPLAFALFEDGRFEEALDYFKQADHKLGGAEPKLQIGKIYLFGLKDKSDPVEGVKWLKLAASMPFDTWNHMPEFDPREPGRNTSLGEAAMILADIYGRGYGPIAKDPEQQRKYLERAYYVGHIEAAKMLGDIYYEGRDTPRDLKKAFRAYRDAAKFAHGPAMLAIANMYETGEAEGGADPKKALAWRAEAAKRDDPAALFALAVAYDHGDEVERDPERALALYKLSAMRGEPAAISAIGTYLYRGEGGLERDMTAARGWFLEGAVRGDPDGMVNLAVMMARGEGGEIDRVKAWGWLKIAERMGHPQAAAAVAALETKFTDEDRKGVMALARAG